MDVVWCAFGAGIALDSVAGEAKRMLGCTLSVDRSGRGGFGATVGIGRANSGENGAGGERGVAEAGKAKG